MSRFGKLVGSLKRRKHPPKNPGAVAAYIGRRKYGKAKFQQMAAAGRRKKGRH